MGVTVQRLSLVLIQPPRRRCRRRPRQDRGREANTALPRSARLRASALARPSARCSRTFPPIASPRRCSSAWSTKYLPRSGIDEQKVQFVSAPQIEREQFDEAVPFSYKAYRGAAHHRGRSPRDGLTAKRPALEVKEEQVGEELLEEKLVLTASDARGAQAADRGAQKGDVATIDSRRGGRSRARSSTTRAPTTSRSSRRSGTLLPEIEAALADKKPGRRSGSPDIAMPASHPHKKLKGRSRILLATFRR